MITRENYEIWFLDYAEGKLNSAQQKMLFTFLEENKDLKRELDAFENTSIEKPILGDEKNKINLKKKQSWLLEKYSVDELVFNFCENNLSKEELREWNDLVKTMPNLLTMVEAEQKMVLKPLDAEKFNSKLVLKKNPVAYSIDITNYQEHFILFAESKELGLHSAITNFLKTNPHLKSEFELTQKLILKADTSIAFENKNKLKKKENQVAFYLWRSIAVAASIILAVIFFYPDDDVSEKTYANRIDSSSVKANKGPKNEIAPNNLIKKENSLNNYNTIATLNKKKIELEKRIRKSKKDIEDVIKYEKVENKNENNFVENDMKENKHENVKQDSIKPNNPVVNQKPENNLATNNEERRTNNDPVIDNPLRAVASVINKKYYEDTTPKSETTSPFYAMKNVVQSASGGNADISKKEDSDYKEFGFKIGEFKFSRKKNKNKVEE